MKQGNPCENGRFLGLRGKPEWRRKGRVDTSGDVVLSLGKASRARKRGTQLTGIITWRK